ncbi:Dynein light chain 4, axonemal [Entophlyctis sp. JEL0112]|nr:Dynein light chain 4, axonemal [Entophlyctis sp. JEL0112]
MDAGSTANLAAAAAPTGADTGKADDKDLRKNFNYPLVKVCDMVEELKLEVVDMVVTAVEKHFGNYEVASMVIKELMDKRCGSSWHVVVGEGFGFDVTHEMRNLMFMYFGADAEITADLMRIIFSTRHRLRGSSRVEGVVIGFDNLMPAGDVPKRPPGVVTDALIDLTSSDIPDLDWTAIPVVLELVRSIPGSGYAEAMTAFRYRLKIEDPVSIFYTLIVLNYFFENAGIHFQNELAVKDNLHFLQYGVINRSTLAPENRGQLLELVTSWGISPEAPPAFRELFEKMAEQGYRFSESCVRLMSPDVASRHRKAISSKSIFQLSGGETHPRDLPVPSEAPSSSLAEFSPPSMYNFSAMKQAALKDPIIKSATSTGIDRTKEIKSATSAGIVRAKETVPSFSAGLGDKPFSSGSNTFKSFDPRKFNFGMKAGGNDREGFALLRDDDDE